MMTRDEAIDHVLSRGGVKVMTATDGDAYMLTSSTRRAPAIADLPKLGTRLDASVARAFVRERLLGVDLRSVPRAAVDPSADNRKTVQR